MVPLPLSSLIDLQRRAAVEKTGEQIRRLYAEGYHVDADRLLDELCGADAAVATGARGMSRVIYKYELRSWTLFIDVPKGATVLSVGTQEPESIVAWLLVDSDAPRVTRMLAAHPTGIELPYAYDKATFVGTVQMNGGLVFHVFDGGEQ